MRIPLKNITGQTFDRLTAIRYAGQSKHNDPLWVFKCSCGKETTAERRSVERGLTRSCGCLRFELNKARDTRGWDDLVIEQGECNHPLYDTWRLMHARCRLIDPRHHRYNGRGISVCPRWSAFANFVSDMSARPQGTTLHRKDNDGNYEPSNCVWADSETQANCKSTTRWLTFDGKTQSLSMWAREAGITPGVFYQRLCINKWSMERALLTPVRHKARIHKN